MKNQIYLIFATAIGWNIRVYRTMHWCFACFFFYWAWIKQKNTPLLLVGVTSKDHWDHLNQNPRLKVLEFVASKSRKVMPAQEENEDRFCPAGWTNLVWNWWNHWLSEKNKYMLDVFVCFSWMKVLSIPSKFLPFSIFLMTLLKGNVDSLIQFFCISLLPTYISHISCCFISKKDADFCRRRIRPRSSRTFPGRWSSPMSSWSSWRAHYLGGRSSDWLVV